MSHDKKDSDAFRARIRDADTRLAHMTKLNIYDAPHHNRKCSIICTIGPDTNSVEALLNLAHAGMNIVRMNFSHGSYEYHQSVVDNTRAAEKLFGRPIAVALDTKGPEIRTGVLADGKREVLLQKDSKIVVTTDDALQNNCSEELLWVDYKNLPNVIDIGQFIYVDDGLISLQVDEKTADSVKCTVVNSGLLGGRKGVNLPGTNVDLPALSAKDIKDLEFGVRNDVDMIFASFIRKPEDVLHIREVLGPQGKDIAIISKIENHEGVRNFDAILAVTDGVMVARGDLGIEIPAQKVFLAQKMIISKCNIAGKPVICATQMLESMTVNPRPTRAEVSDVANAVLDGSDCVMLSGETAKGKYPLEAVRMMDNICKEAEGATFYGKYLNELRKESSFPMSMTETVACSSVTAALENAAGAIVVLTTTGTTARLIAKYRPACPILVVTRSVHVARLCHLYRACYPVLTIEKEGDFSNEIEWQRDVDTRINFALEWAKGAGVISSGETAVAVQGWKGGAGNTNCMRIVSAP